MNILLVSQCHKNALTETRRILDQFAERRGERVWQTSITQAGLSTLHRLLRKSARKNTAVACHWIHGRNHSELLWIVGDRACFNSRGAVPTNVSSSDILRASREDTWHSLPLIRFLAGMSALLHDLGKACKAFQAMLRGKKQGKNLFRHEWISLCLFQAFVGDSNDAQWLNCLAKQPDGEYAERWSRLSYTEALNAVKPMQAMENAPLAAAVSWLFLSHHRLPCPLTKCSQESELKNLWKELTVEWNQRQPLGKDDTLVNGAKAEHYWVFPQGLPVFLSAWKARAAELAGEFLRVLENAPRNPLEDPFIMHLARLALMLGDHVHSSQDAPGQKPGKNNQGALYANTCKDGSLKQKLEEHLLGVARHSIKVARSLPYLSNKLPPLPRLKKLEARSEQARFHWQNKAVEAVAALRQSRIQQGAFIVNMASTGCGKTLANLKIMQALADPDQGLRCAFALGLRVLTWQTGTEYRERLNLGEDLVAVLAGGTATQRLYESRQEDDQEEYASLSADAHTLLDEDIEMHYDGEENPLLRELLPVNIQTEARRLLEAPLLCCTVDHLMPAVENLRGGRQILPMLRLLSGDLVLDELDDYDVDDLPALTRLVFWAGLLGCRVLLSSATMPPSLAQGMFAAYLAGRRYFQKHRGERPLETPSIACAWIDEFGADTEILVDNDNDGESFARLHEAFAKKRSVRLVKDASLHPRRRAELWPLNTALQAAEDLPEFFATQIREAAMRLHTRHGMTDARSGSKVSFGLVRMANINPLFHVAKALLRQGAPDGFHIHLCVYHSRFPLLLRSSIERRLDRVLKRSNNADPCAKAEIRQILNRSTAPNHIFLVLASPIAEVGRDHDYDWAVVEPSSLRSIIQLAGRVWRHRPDLCCTEPNIIIFDRNYKCLEHPDNNAPAYLYPGFESKDRKFRLKEHILTALLREEEYGTITSSPRILPHPENFDPLLHLADLEHDRLKAMMIPKDNSLGAYSCRRTPLAMLSGLLQEKQRFRSGSQENIDWYLKPHEDEEEYTLTYMDTKRNQEASRNYQEKRISLEAYGSGIDLWGEVQYMSALKEWAEKEDMDLQACAKLYGTISLPKLSPGCGWFFHHFLGFAERK